jgi:hypothetical protein
MVSIKKHCPEMFKKDTITVRDTIMVRDTIVIHDTIKVAGSEIVGKVSKDSLDKGDTLSVSNPDADLKIWEETDMTGKKKIVYDLHVKPKKIPYEKKVYYQKKVPYEVKVPVEIPCDCTTPPFYTMWWFWVIVVSVLMNVFLGWIVSRKRT